MKYLGSLVLLFFLELLLAYQTCGVLQKRTCQYITEVILRCEAAHGEF